MRRIPTYIAVLVGVLCTLLVVFVWRGCTEKKADVINQDYYLITNQIEKMNKMVVLEQNFSSFQTHKSSAFQFGGYDILPKEMVLYTTAKAQVSYDLKQMKIDVDTVNKKLVITELPRAEIKIYPDVKIHFMDDYAINRFDQKSINGILESAKQNMAKSIDQKKLEQQGHEQLVHNLNDIFVLAKALHYTVEDKTGELKGIIL
ncbi:DUF4230 domain-containing protein [Elizabethkingia meningoseptica]|uniref:DUF4230 domain-containing protein n=1 Tax=Elizabethkingia meningoseptica TaxID=238 RepID=UPI0013664D3F|nr:DUF4230 domain-containing protein [Elizabethkingia meningoseptica]MDE5489719.1 DUF4230 domain-containing protein [Elizabethkingia meningoseptica]MVW91414.1 DUF4230 domain-containing protein [Elizabethkingia meningoseptica]